MDTNDIIKSLGMMSPSVMPPSLINIIHERLEEADDIKETYQHVIDEKCAGDEVHCACVPYLRTEIARMKDELDFYHSPEGSSIKRLQHQNYRMGLEIAENSVRFLVFNEVAKERDELRNENERLRIYAPLNCDDYSEGQTEMVVDGAYFNELMTTCSFALAHLRAIVTANATMQDMSQPLEDALRLLEDSQ